MVSIKRLLILATASLALASLSSCSVTPEDYRGETPEFDMAEYFNGPLEAWGIFQDYTGKVVRRFHVKMQGTWNGNEGILEELFTYTDGTTQTRTWKLKKLDEHRYTGTAEDVVGTAEGVAYGNALRWRYTMALEVDDDVYHVQFDDWMYLMDEHVVINRSLMKKFGVTVGEVTLVFSRNKTLTTTTYNISTVRL
jgi:hypothetical protein